MCTWKSCISLTIWTATVGENLTCTQEPTNESDRYAVVMIKDGSIIGYTPQKMPHVCSMFLRRGSSITCLITGTQVDLLQGGMITNVPVKSKIKLREKNLKFVCICMLNFRGCN